MRIKNSVLTIIFLVILVVSASLALAMPYFNGVVIYTNPYNYSATNTSLITSFFVFDNATTSNVTCHLDSQAYPAQSTGVNSYQCSMVSPLTQGNFDVVYNATNINNETNFTTSSFSTIPSTTGTLTFTPNGQYVMNMTYNSQETRLINATLANTGSAPMFDAKINITRFENNFATTSAMVQSCGTIPAGQSCTKTFDINIPANTQSQVYHVYFNADWTNPDAVTADNVFEINTWIRVVYNPEAVVTPEINITGTPTQTTSTITNVQSIGNVPLSAVNITYAGGSLPNSWITISPDYFAQINAGSSQTYQINVTPPAGAAIGLYTGTVDITSNDNPKTQTLNVNVGPYYGWTSNISQTTAYNQLQTSGTLTQLTVNNTGNVGQSFQVTYSGTLYSNGYLTDPSPSIISLNPGQTYTMNINYNNFVSVDGIYTLNIQVQNLNTSTNQNHQAQLIAESTAPSLTVVSPTNNSAISGMANFQVTASDTLSGMQKVDFYVDSILKGTDNDTSDSTFTYQWNTSLAADKIITIEARAYDQIGNTNRKIWFAYNQNPANSLPYLNSSIPDLVILEDNTTTAFPIDIIFNDHDYGETLTYSFSGNDNITIVVGGGIAYIIPNADFYGFRTVTATATDTQGANVSDTFNINVLNVQDVPTTPFINAPLNGSVISSATGTVNFQWTASYDPDPEPLSYRLFLGTDTPQLYQVTANTQLTATGLAPGSYNWYLLVYDGVTTVQTSTYSFQLLPNAYPQINSYTPTSATVNVIKNNTLNFTVSVTEPDNETLTHNWTLGGIQVSTSNNYTFDSTNQPLGIQQLVYTASDPNQNSVGRSWSVQISENNQPPVLTQNFSYVEITGSQTTLNLYNYFADPNTADTLTFSASPTNGLGFIFNNGMVTITPANGFFGIRMVTFSATDGTSTAYSNPILVIVRKDNQQPEINGLDPEDDDLKIDSDQNLEFNVEFFDNDYDPVSVYWYVNNELKQSDIKSKYNLKEYPLQYISNGEFNGKIVVGEKGTIKESQAANSIINTLKSYTFEINDFYTDEEVSHSSSSNLIILGTPDHNHLVEELLDQVEHKIEFAPGEALIKSVEYNNHIAIIITGYSDEDVLEAVGYFNDFEISSLGTDEVKINTVQNTLEYEISRQSSFEYFFEEGEFEVEVGIIDGNGAGEVIEWEIEARGRPVVDSFNGDTTDFEGLTEEELQEVELVLEKTNHGKIEFDNLLNLSHFIDFDEYVEIGSGYIAIDTDVIPELAGQPATVTLYNVYVSNPVVFYTSSFTTNPNNANTICTNCQIISYENNELTFHVNSFSSYFIGETQAASISLPDEIQLGNDNEIRGQNITTQFTISNPGNEDDIEEITIKTTASSKYMVQFSTDGTNYDSDISLDLDLGESQTIYLKGYIPSKENSGKHSIGQVTASNGEYSASSVLYIYPLNSLEIISVKIDDDSVSDGDEAKIKPDQDLEVEIEVENTGSIDFDTVNIIGTIYDLDGDDVEEEVEFSLSDGRKRKSTLIFDVPEQLDDNEYKLEIKIKAEDDDGIIHSQSLEYALITTKEKHQLKLDASLSTEVMECVRQGTIRAEIINLGANDEDDVRLEIKENNLGINFVKDSIEINEDDDFRTSFALNLEDQDAGNYKFIVSVYRDNKLSEEKTLDLEIQDCGQSKGVTQTKSTKAIEQEHQKLITAALAAQQQQPVTKVEKKQGINEWAMVMLIITVILTLGIIIFVVGAAIIKRR